MLQPSNVAGQEEHKSEPQTCSHTWLSAKGNSGRFERASDAQSKTDFPNRAPLMAFLPNSNVRIGGQTMPIWDPGSCPQSQCMWPGEALGSRFLLGLYMGITRLPDPPVWKQNLENSGDLRMIQDTGTMPASTSTYDARHLLVPERQLLLPSRNKALACCPLLFSAQSLSCLRASKSSLMAGDQRRTAGCPAC